MKSSKPTISFFSPAYKEEENLPIVVEKAIEVLKKVASKFEVVIVEDGSPDKTGRIADSLSRKHPKIVRVIHHKKNLGYGPALKTGFEKANKYDYVFYTDSDLQFDLSELKRLTKHLGSHDVVIGYRINRALAFKRLVQTIIYNFMVKLLFGLKAKDINCSMKIVKRSVMDKIKLQSKSAFIDAELLIKLRNLNVDIKEIGVAHYPRVAGKAYGGKPSVIWETFSEMISFWWKLNKKRVIDFLPLLFLGIFSVFSALAIFYTPYAFWAEAITENWFIENGLVMYKDFVHHHTPLLRFILYGFSKILGNSPHTLRLYSFIITEIMAVLVYLSSKRISKKAASFSMLIFGVLFFPLFRNFHLEEMTVATFLLASIYFAFRYIDERKKTAVFMAGVFLASSVMVKQNAVFAAIPIVLVVLLDGLKRKAEIKKIIGSFVSLLLGGLLIVLPIIYYFYLNGALYDFFYYNIIFNLTIYNENTTAYALSDGIRTAWPLVLVLVPLGYVIWRKRKDVQFFLKAVLLFLFIALLLSALLPSFLPIRLLPLFGGSVLAWCIVAEQVFDKRNMGNKVGYSLLLVSFLIFVLGELKFLSSYYTYHFPRSFPDNSLLYDYGQDEKDVVKWLKENTEEGTRIMNMAHHPIFYLSGRLPENKYVYLLPWLVMPYEESTREILDSPPRLIIRDLATERDWPDLKNWKFLVYLEENYEIRQTFNDHVIYVKKD